MDVRWLNTLKNCWNWTCLNTRWSYFEVWLKEQSLFQCEVSPAGQSSLSGIYPDGIQWIFVKWRRRKWGCSADYRCEDCLQDPTGALWEPSHSSFNIFFFITEDHFYVLDLIFLQIFLFEYVDYEWNIYDLPNCLYIYIKFWWFILDFLGWFPLISPTH